MPSASRVTWAQLRVGLLALAAMAILAALIFLLTGQRSLFAREATIYTYMDDSAALARGAPVRLNGILIGTVTAIELSGSAQPNRVVRVAMSIPRERLSDVPIDSVAAISAENVLGTKYINIRMGTSRTHVQPGAELRSLDTREFEQVVQASYNVVASLNGILKRVDAIVSEIEAGRGSIGKFIGNEEFYNRVLAAVSDFQKVTAALSSGKGTLGRLLYEDALYTEVRGSIQRLDALMKDVQQGQGTAGRLVQDPALYNEARATLAELRRTMENLNKGQGTAGKLLTDDTLYQRANALIARMEDTLERVNSGQGTLGQLVVNPELYNSIRDMTTEMQSLIKDFRANPRKYMRIRIGLF